MGLVSPTQSSPGETIEAADINTPINQLAAVINGNIETANLADSSVTTAKVADDSITSVKTTELPLATQRQGNATVAAIADPVLKFGWAQLTATTAKTQTYALTFGTAFDNNPIVTATIAGYKTAGATDVNAGSALTADCISAYAENISTTGCTLRAIASSASLPNVDLLICWQAIGSKAR